MIEFIIGAIVGLIAGMFLTALAFVVIIKRRSMDLLMRLARSMPKTLAEKPKEEEKVA